MHRPFNGQRVLRDDSAASAFLTNQLVAYDPQVYETIYADPQFQKLIPINNKLNPGATEAAYAIYEAVGLAAWYSGTGEDLPLVKAIKSRHTHPIKPFGAKSVYSDDELEQSAFEQQTLRGMGVQNGTTIDTEQEKFAAMAVAQFHEGVAVSGDTTLGIRGVINQLNVSSYTIPNGEAGSPLWANKTADEILLDMQEATAFVVSAVKGNAALVPDTMVLPLASYQLASTRRLPYGTNQTVLDHFLQSNKFVKYVEPWARLDGASSGDNFGMVYRRDPMVLEYRTGKQYERKPPQRKGMGWEVNHVANSGGVVVKYPVAVAYFTGF